jgi:hypothetical protein
MTFPVTRTKTCGITVFYKIHLIVLKDKLNFEHFEQKIEWVLISDKVYNQLVLFV